MSADQGAESPTEAQAARLWEHGLHLDAMLFQRANLFLVAESLLVVAYATLLAAAGSPGSRTDRAHILLIAELIAIFGIGLSVIWLYVAHRHLRYDSVLTKRLVEWLPEYAETRARYRATGRSGGISSGVMVTYTLPGLAGAMWVSLLIIT